MLMPASAEFVALCRSQVALLTQALGANLSIVYLTEEWNQGEDANLVPVVAHPEAAADWDREQIVALLSGRSLPNQLMGQLPSASGAQEEKHQVGLTDVQRSTSVNPTAPLSEALAHPAQYPQQIVLPLVHEGVVMGLLVTARSDRPWRSQEQTQVERIARTLAIACMLDQKAQWADHEMEQQALLRTQQHDLMDDLIHQFRNPLTALRTFGKLLVKRLLPEDPNRNVAEGIVRESDRLQDLLLQLDSAIDVGPAGLLPPAQDNSPSTASSVGQDAPRLLPGTSIVANLTLGPHEVNEVLEPLLDTEMAIAQDRQIQIRVEIPPHLPTVHIDLKALQEVLNNLIDNALKYTPSGGQVLVIAGLEQMVATTAFQGIAIIDNGPGIPAEDLPRLFQRHYRGSQAQSNIPGTGLGLAIARDLMQQMHGEIQVFSPAHTSGLVASEWEQGTAVIVWLPESSED